MSIAFRVRRRRLFPSVIALLLLFSGGVAATAQDLPGIEIVESRPGELILRLSSFNPGLSAEKHLVAADHPWFFQEDATTIPRLRGLIALPAGAIAVDAEIVGRSTEVSALRVGDLRRGNDYGIPIVIGGADYAGVRLVTVDVPAYDSDGSILRFPRSLTLRLSWSMEEKETPRSTRQVSLSRVEREIARDIPHFSEALAADRGQTARTERSSISPTTASAGADWGLGEEALILLVDKDAPYRLSASDFLESGGPAGTSYSVLRLAHRGEPVNAYYRDANENGLFDEGDYLAFRGWRNRPDGGGHYSRITDTNAYVLTWSGGDGTEPAPVTQIDDVVNVAEHYSATVHFEKELLYYFGIPLPDYLEGDETTIHVTEQVQHEGYYWGSVLDSRREAFEFDCAPRFSNNSDVRVDVRLVSVHFPADGEVRTQAVRIFLNGVLIGTVDHPDTADIVYPFDVPVNVLINGINRITLDYGSPSVTSFRKVLLDHVAITGEWYPLAEQGVVTLPSGNEEGYYVDRLDAGSGVGSSEIETVVDVAGDSFFTSYSAVDKGHLIRTTSRSGTALRSYPGFFLQVGDEQFSSDGNSSLGVSVAELRPEGTGLRVVRFRHVRTAGDIGQLDVVADFVDDVAIGNIVVAGTAYGTGSHDKTPAFVSAFRGLGSDVVESESLFASPWVFAAIKGRPETAVEEHRGGGDDRGISKNIFIPDSDRGVSLRGTAVTSGTSGQDVEASLPMSPAVRYHDGDRLVDPSNRADLIIVSHPLFRTEAERLAEHRRSYSGLEVEVVDVYRVYDEFNYGEKDPTAIRHFLQYADSSWGNGEYPPSYVILFGDANWDAEQRIPGSSMIDYIPSFGVPSTDQKFVVAFGDTTLAPQQFIGRLPASNVSEARAVVDKLIAYDGLEPADWHKHFVFATGGNSVAERDDLRASALSLASIITSDAFYGSAEVISRTGTTDAELALPNSIDGPRVQAAMNRGGLWLDFNGHGATTTLDLNFGFPEDFDNGRRQFVLATWSCQTGLYSNRDGQLRNESFLLHPGKGSIASIGGTSFSYTNMDDPMRRSIFRKIATEPASRAIGPIFHLSKLELFAQFFYGSPFVSYGTRARNQMMMYNLLGDPSMKLAVSSRPELTVPVESVRLLGERGTEPALGDTTLRVRGALWNFGVPLEVTERDSVGVSIRLTLVDPQGRENSTIDTVFGLRRHDSIDLMVPVADIPGEYVVIIDVDLDDRIEEEEEEDNRTVLQFLLRGSQPLALEPLMWGTVEDPDQLELRILNPASGPGARYVIDTVPSLTSPAAISSEDVGQVIERELTTTWRLSLPESMRGADAVWWRATSTSGDPDLADRYPLEASFRLRSPDADDEHYSIGGQEQMGFTRLENLVNAPDGVGPGERLVPMEVTSIGQTFTGRDNSTPEISVPKLTVRVGSENYRVNSFDGINVLVFPRNDVVPVIDTFFTFYVGTPLSALEDLVANHIEPGQRVVVGSSGASFELNDENGYARLSAVFDQLGSRVADTIGDWDWWGSYALIGGKGVPDDEVKEAWIPGGVLYDRGEFAPFPVTVRDTIVAFPTDGRWRSTTVGPALSWSEARFDIELGGTGEVTSQVLGVRKDGGRDLLRSSNLSDGNRVIDLSDINAGSYPRLEFSVAFGPDTTQRLRQLSVDFQPSPELAIVPSSVQVEHDSVLQGDPVRISATVANLTSFSTASDVTVLVRELGETGGIVDTVEIPNIHSLDSARVELVVETTRLREGRSYLLEVNPEDRPSEPYSHNNRSRVLNVDVTTDQVSPSLAVYADDSRLVGGDYVAPQPTFEIRLFDNSSLELDEVRTITMVLDNQWITVENGAQFEIPTTGDDDFRGSFRWSPSEPLDEGPHDIRVFARDASGNGDTTEIITFYVESDLGIRNLYTWPNPMQKETTFTFAITGAVAPESAEISIYTPAGRRIRTIDLGPGEIGVGYNRVEWDGRDADGDRPANGVYFYRIRVRSGDEQVEMIDKIAILR